MRPLYPKWQVVGRALTKVLGQQYARAVPLSLSFSLWNIKGRVKFEQKTMDELFAQSELLVQLLELRIRDWDDLDCWWFQFELSSFIMIYLLIILWCFSSRIYKPTLLGHIKYWGSHRVSTQNRDSTLKGITLLKLCKQLSGVSYVYLHVVSINLLVHL